MAEIAEKKDLVSEIYEPDKWRKVSYKTKLCEGKMLLAGQESKPEPITLNLNIKGWHRIFISIMNLRSENYTYVKLSDDSCFTGVRSSGRLPIQWCPTECVEEIYWKSADLTNQKVVLARPEYMHPITSALLWIRLEKMSEDEILEFKTLEKKKNHCIQMHFDEDFYTENALEYENDHIMRLYQLKNSNVDFFNLEYSYSYDYLERNNDCSLLRCDTKRTDFTYKDIAKRKEYIKDAIDFCHDNGFEIYATERMCTSNFFTPYSLPNWNKNFVKRKEFHCINRDGSTTTISSYAFEEVQQYIIDNMLHFVKMGFDGVSMIYHRGMYIGFEKPVIDRFSERYPDVDPYLLPMSDERLCSVRCEIMTEFMQKVRNALDSNFDKHIKVNVLGEYGLETAKYMGLDIETWAKNGLIDSASQTDMELYEDLTDCMSDENPSLIDMAKYKKRLEDYPVIRRNYGTDIDKVCLHTAEYSLLEEKYGIKVYHILPWPHAVDYTEYDQIIERMKKSGAKRFFSWNTDHLVWDLPEWYIVSHIGNKRNDNIPLRRFFRTLSLDDNDVTHFSPNWMG